MARVVQTIFCKPNLLARWDYTGPVKGSPRSNERPCGAARLDRVVEDGCATLFKPSIKAIGKFSQISVQMFTKDMGVIPSNPRL